MRGLALAALKDKSIHMSRLGLSRSKSTYNGDHKPTSTITLLACLKFKIVEDLSLSSTFAIISTTLKSGPEWRTSEHRQRLGMRLREDMI